MDAHGPLLVEGLTALALATRLAIRLGIEAVDGFGKNAGTRGLAYATRAAEQVGMRQLSVLDGVLERGGQSTLPNHTIEGCWSVFAGRNYKFIHV